MISTLNFVYKSVLCEFGEPQVRKLNYSHDVPKLKILDLQGQTLSYHDPY